MLVELVEPEVAVPELEDENHPRYQTILDICRLHAVRAAEADPLSTRAVCFLENSHTTLVRPAATTIVAAAATACRKKL